MQLMNIAVFVSGRGSNLKALLDAKASGGLAQVHFAVVFSDVARPPAFKHAEAHGVPTLHLLPKMFPTKADYEHAVIEAVQKMGAGWIVLAGYMRIVGKALLEAFPNRIINIHPSLLPAFPGLHAQKQAVDHGVKVSGCTVHFVDEGMDTGPIILQKTVPCFGDDTEDSLSARILEQEHLALPEALALLSRQKMEIVGRKVILTPRDSKNGPWI